MRRSKSFSGTAASTSNIKKETQKNNTPNSKGKDSPKKSTKRKRELENDDFDDEGDGKENKIKNSSIYPRSLTAAVSVTPKKVIINHFHSF